MTQMNLYMNQEQNRGHEELTGGCQGGGVQGGVEWEVGVSKCKLFCIEWINSKVVLYSTENYIQYPRINHKGKNVCVYITDSLIISMISVFLNLLRFVYWTITWSVLEMFSEQLRRILLLSDELLCFCLLSPFGLTYNSSLVLPHWRTLWMIYSLWKVGY